METHFYENARKGENKFFLKNHQNSWASNLGRIFWHMQITSVYNQKQNKKYISKESQH